MPQISPNPIKFIGLEAKRKQRDKRERERGERGREGERREREGERERGEESSSTGPVGKGYPRCH